MELTAWRYDLLLKETFTISKGSRDVQPTVIVRLCQDGNCGYGEAPAVFHYGITAKDFLEQAKRAAKTLRDLPFESPERLHQSLKLLPIHPFLRSAIDQAAYDLYGRIHDLPTWQYLGGRPDNLPLTSFTLGLAPPDTLKKKISATPWPIYKIKLSAHNCLPTVEFIRKHTNAELYVDANAAWTAEQCIRLAPALRDLGVTMIEQPLPTNAPTHDFVRVFQESVLPIFADESCQTEDDVQAAAGRFHGINIKLAKCGGITPARRMIQMARELDLGVMVGCMVESSVGISAAAQLLPFVDKADMDGALLLSNDIADGITIDNGRITLSDQPGNGIRLLTQK